MKIATLCRMLASRSHWVIHSIWLLVLAVVICANVVFDYFQILADGMRLLVSENNIAASMVKSELSGVTGLLNAVENLATEQEDGALLSNAHKADHLGALARSHPLVASIQLADSLGLIASSGTVQEQQVGAVFVRTRVVQGHTPLTVTVALSRDFWQQRLAAFNAADARAAVYTVTGRGLMPFAGMTAEDEQALVAAIRGMDTDSAALNTGYIRMGGESQRLVLRQVAAPFVVEGPLVVATAMNNTEVLTRWRSNMLVQLLAWAAAATISTTVLQVEARSRRQFEMSAVKMHENGQEREKFISVLMEHAPIMVSYWDARRTCRYANKMYRAWFGKTEAQIVGIDVGSLLGAEQYEKCAPLIDATLRGEAQHFEQSRVKADGTTGYVLSRYIPDSDGLGVRGFFVIASDITELKHIQLQLEKRIEDLYSMATTDALTGLDNRRNLLEKVQLEIDRARRYGLSVGFLMVDIDHFKNINDTYGHDAGDRVLQRLGVLLRETMRAPDHVGRLGGEEFGILLTNVTALRTKEIAELLRIRTAGIVVTYGEEQISFTVSIGVADLRVDAENPLLDMMKRADAALYKAKNSGRNCVRLADDLPESVLIV